LLIVAGVALLWATAIFGRLGYLQLYRHRDYLLRAQHQQQRVIEISPKRGAIYDRNMHALAMSIKVDSAFAIPNEIKDKALAAQLLSGVLGLPADLVESRLDSSQNFVWIERKLTPEKSEAVTALNLKGVYTQAENKRFYPKADLASHVVGFVDVDEKGRAINLHDSILRLRYRKGVASPESMIPNHVYRIEISGLSTGNYFAPGHRLRIELAGSNFPNYERNLHTGGHNYDESATRPARIDILHDAQHPSFVEFTTMTR